MNRQQFLALTTGWMAAAGTAAARRALAAVDDDPVSPDLPPAAPRVMSAEARVILQYIQDNFGKKILAGQHGGQRRVDYVTRTTGGKTPAIWGTDLINRRDDARTLAFIKNTWKAGAIPTVMWHWGAPTLGDGYPQSMSVIDVSACFQPGTPENDAMWVDLKSRADFLTKVRDAKIPVLWRPLHENSGGWFWWDKGGPELFVKVWRTMHDYFTKERGLDNLIWVDGMCGRPKASFNPGAGYYDIIGGDTYGGQEPWTRMYRSVERISPRGMPIALHECGGPPDPGDAFAQGALWSWFMVWDTYIEKVDPAQLTAVYQHELTLTLDKLPSWQTPAATAG